MDSIKNNRVILLIITLLLTVQLYLPQVDSLSVENIEISIAGQQPQVIQGTPVMVAGIWHYVNLTLTNSQLTTLTLALYEGNNPPEIANQNENTYYEWQYNAGNWQEITQYGEGKYSYINITRCRKTDNAYSFYIGIKSDIIQNTNPDEIDFESWTLEITADTTQIRKSQIFIEEGPPLLSLVRKVHNLLESKNDGSIKGVDEETLSSIKYILDRMLSEREKTCKRIDQKKPPNVYFELTPRELEVLAWLSRGFSYDETASHLHISKNTIKTHLQRIYSKLEVGNRLQAVNKAKEMGLIV